MNAVEQFMSDVCDYAEMKLRSDPALERELNALLTNGQQPHVVRSIPGAYMALGFSAEGVTTGADS